MSLNRSVMAFCAFVLLAGQAARGNESVDAHYQKAKAAFDAARWDEAVAELEQAYALDPQPIFLFSIARAEQGKGDLPRAITAYQRFLDNGGKDPKASEAHLAVTQMQVQLEAKRIADERAKLDAEKARMAAERARMEEEKARLEKERAGTAAPPVPTAPTTPHAAPSPPAHPPPPASPSPSSTPSPSASPSPPASPSPSASPRSSAPVSTSEPHETGWSTRRQRTSAYVAVALGVGALIGGSVAAALAASRWGDVTPKCRNTGECDPFQVTQAHDARTAADASTATFVAGGVLVAAGAALFLTAPLVDRAKERRHLMTRIHPWLTGGAGGVLVKGSF